MFVSAEANLYASELINTDNSLLVETHLKCSVSPWKGCKNSDYNNLKSLSLETNFWVKLKSVVNSWLNRKYVNKERKQCVNFMGFSDSQRFAASITF